MTSRERVGTVLHRGVPDRVPVNYSANPGIDARLKAHFGLGPDDGDVRDGAEARRVRVNGSRRQTRELTATAFAAGCAAGAAGCRTARGSGGGP
jgi:hypothetical protein